MRKPCGIGEEIWFIEVPPLMGSVTWSGSCCTANACDTAIKGVLRSTALDGDPRAFYGVFFFFNRAWSILVFFYACTSDKNEFALSTTIRHEGRQARGIRHNRTHEESITQ